eukprot:m.67462 g.67462  ORF g.67462 m.67462 type:complete len:354 (+) comp16631_c0_seq1:1200-2261(+)
MSTRSGIFVCCRDYGWTGRFQLLPGGQLHRLPAVLEVCACLVTIPHFHCPNHTTHNTCANICLSFARNFIKKPTKEQIACQHPKPILLDVGEITPYPWVPLVLPIQLMKIGSFVLASVPGEFTTMSGRRLRKTVAEAFAKHGQQVTVVIAGLSNGYSGYIATYEEYQFQRYEAASTLYGPHTLAAYQQEFYALAEAMATGSSVDPGQPWTNGSYVNFELDGEPLWDTHPLGKKFGDVQTDVSRTSFAPGETVNVTFFGGNLRHDFFQNSSYLFVQRQESDGSFVTLLTDANWETKVTWKKEEVTQSLITCEWQIAADAPAGTYRIVHQGKAKPDPLSSKLVSYQGESSLFVVA